ncbi:MAG: serine/threonine-protein kinase [Thermoguttaceae bacterium]|nr:serine/threonine-protein kinase [Thermoguttaceae bacterium]
MSDISMEQAVNRTLELGLMTAQQVQEIRAATGNHSISGEDFLNAATRRNFLTPYQVERLLSDQPTGLFYGDYKILYFVGAGTFGRVFRAVHRITGEMVALKVLRQKYSDDPEAAKQFIEEGNLGKKLQHPNIVAIREVHTSRSEHYFVMEFIEGSNLREFLKIRGTLSPIEAVRMTLGIARGLEFASKFGVTHRDLRLSNVLVSSTGEAKLLDFGLAAMEKSDSDDFTSRTVDYAALENSTGAPRDDRRSDIFFAGAILYHLLAGESAYEETKGRSQRVDPDRFKKMEPIQKRLPDIPISVATVVQRAMALDPNKRYQTPGEFADDLQNVLTRLEQLEQGDTSSVEVDDTALATPVAPVQVEAKCRGTFFVVESDPQFQDLFRNGFRKNRLRVILTSDPQRGAERIQQSPTLVACALFSTHKLGRAAFDAFNSLKDELATQEVPAILLLDEKHSEWKEELSPAPHRLVLEMPVGFRALREAVDYLLEKFPPIMEDEEDEELKF